MLQKLNERIQGLVAWIIISLVAVTFTLFGVDYYLQAHHDTSVQVEVNGQPITKQAFELSYRRTRQSRNPSQITAVGEKQLKQQLLNEMILNAISVQSARASGFEINSSQADAAILSIPQFQEDGHFSSGRYTQALNNAFFTPETFQKEVRQGMLLNQQRFSLIGTAFALPGDIQKFIKLYLQTRNYDYLQISARQFLSDVAVSDKDIAAYYHQHQEQFLAPEQVSIDYIRLSMQDIKKSIEISELQLKRYYDENKPAMEKPFDEVKADIQEQLMADRAQTKYAQKLEMLSDLSYQTPDSLAPVAEALKLKVEQSKLFSEQGGEISLLKNKQIIQAAFSHDVMELGNNSDPIQLDNDTVVVLRTSKHVPSAEKPLVEVKGLITEILEKQQAQAKAMQLGKELLNAKNTALQQENLIKENKLKWQDVSNASRDTDVAPALINELAFNLPRVGEKAGSSLENGDYVIVSLKAINDGSVEALDKEQVNSITQQLEANYGVMDYELYVSSLMSKAAIVRH